MRACVLLFLMSGASASVLAESSTGLTFDDIVRRSLADPQRLEAAAQRARLERDVASSARGAREGPTLDAEVGPRRVDSGAIQLDAVAHVEFALLSGRRARAEADRALQESGPDERAALAIESRLRLRIAYLDAWLAQERLGVLEAQLAVTARIASTMRTRVEAGAEAPYEIALTQGEDLRLRSECDAARVESLDAWSRLRDSAELPPDPQELASPGPPEMLVPEDAPARFAAGVLSRAAGRRRALRTAYADFEQALYASRWSVAGTLGKEGGDAFATVGGAYRFPIRGEIQARQRERDASVAYLERASDTDAARLETLFRSTLERARQFGPVGPPGAFDDALAAVALRMELGKESPSRALPVRRQLLESEGAALRRLRDAHVLMAELTALTAGEAP